MTDILKFILSTDLGTDFNNWVFLGFRILLLVELIRVHGLKKLEGHHDTPNPLGLPQKLNNFISVLATLYLPIFGILGLGTRLVLIPALTITAIGYFVVHRKDSVEQRDTPYMYTLTLLVLILLGAGTKSVDYYIVQHLLP